MEWFSVATVEPDWNYKQLFYVGDFIAGMNADASKTAHPLVRNVVKPSEVNYISNIIYQKVFFLFNFLKSLIKYFCIIITTLGIISSSNV